MGGRAQVRQRNCNPGAVRGEGERVDVVGVGLSPAGRLFDVRLERDADGEKDGEERINSTLR